MEATRRDTLDDAIAWLAEGHPMPAKTSWTGLLQALVELGDEVDPAALRRVTSRVAGSDLDTSRLVFKASELPTPEQFEAAVRALLSRSSDGTFGGLKPREVLRAQRVNELAISALCLAAGVVESDARGWFGVSRVWKEEQLSELLEYLGQLVGGKVRTAVPDAAPARALELMSGGDGWQTVDDLNAKGAPYGLLLAQRAVGGVWLAHKNKTSTVPNRFAAGEVCGQLAERGIEFRRSSTVGGSVKQKDLQELSGIEDKRVAVVALNSAGKPTFAITFSAARDGGTARANGDGLLQIPTTALPHAIVLTGVGWAARHETDRLASKFGGRLFSDRSIDELVACVEKVTT